MVKRKWKKKTPKNKAIKRIGVFVPMQANIALRKKELDGYIVKQGCQRLTPIYSKTDIGKGIIEIYARVRYIGKRKAKKLKPITPGVVVEELQKIANKLIGFET